PDELHELLWRQKLTEADWKKLRALPEISAKLELESRLSEILAKIPDAPMASNFTARTMQVIEREDLCQSRKLLWRWNWHALLPRAAVVAVAVGLAGFALHHHEISRQRAELAKNVALVAATQPLPSVEALKNFDAIQRMSQPQHADEELIALLQ
ncbi:MAG TPA: hypothetical protein VFC85_05925, partial [Verrucomicrobiae bacterium]|nr:hypothetical protein [Verrucomicrobiae bacterium]